METTLHRQLKQAYATGDHSTEVTMGAFRIDVVRGEELVEIQCASLSALRDKTRRLLERHQVRIVKPVFQRTRITRLDGPDGKRISRRLSPKRGHVTDVFDELIYFTRIFPHPNLTIEAIMVDVEQIRVPAKKRRRRWHKEYTVHDVLLEQVHERYELTQPSDLLALLAWPNDQPEANTQAIADALGRPRWVAQKIAYVLKHVGAIQVTRRTRAGIHYQAA